MPVKAALDTVAAPSGEPTKASGNESGPSLRYLPRERSEPWVMVLH
jgi:hypothetical protein